MHLNEMLSRFSEYKKKIFVNIIISDRVQQEASHWTTRMRKENVLKYREINIERYIHVCVDDHLFVPVSFQRVIIKAQSLIIKCLSFRRVSFVQGYRLCIEKLCTRIILSFVLILTRNGPYRNYRTITTRFQVETMRQS